MYTVLPVVSLKQAPLEWRLTQHQVLKTGNIKACKNCILSSVEYLLLARTETEKKQTYRQCVTVLTYCMTRTTYLSQTRVGFLLSLPFICPVGSKEWKVFLLLTSVLLYSISATSIHLLDPRQLCEASPSFYSYYSTTDQICWLFFCVKVNVGF